MENLTIQEVAKRKKKNRSTVLRWIHQNFFPNAKLKESPFGNYWLIPESDLSNFKEPQRGGKR